MNDIPPPGKPDEVPDKTLILPRVSTPAATPGGANPLPKISADGDLTGTTLGSYRLTRKIAQGGMGQVYEAVQTTLDRKVAVKILTDELAHRPEFLRRFEREAKAAAALNHPNIVQVHDFGEIDGRLFLVMEYVEGQDLSRHVKEAGKLPPAEALQVIRQAALALRAAHQKSIIHRDIKPANIMRMPDGHIKVSDLGLAKVLTDQTTELTLTGHGMGSPHFLAPEQASNARQADHRADMYSLGITLFFLLTDQYPYEGTTPYSIVLAHASTPLPRTADFGIQSPAVVEAFMQRLAAKRPEDRYENYDLLLEDLDRVSQGFSPAARIWSGTWSRRQKGLLATAAVLVVLLLAQKFISPAPEISRYTRKPVASLDPPRSATAFENSLGMKFKQVSNIADRKLFAAIWKTRVRDFSAFVDATGYDATAGLWSRRPNGQQVQEGRSWKDPGFEQTPDHPVCGVSWQDAVKFCEWLTKSERAAKRIRITDTYRLPSDNEWSLLVGSHKYPWGNQWPPPKGAGFYAEPDLGALLKSQILPEGFVRTSPVGLFNPNDLGLYDVGGNLWEWCADWFYKDINSEDIRLAIPLLNTDGGGRTWRVMRGGSRFDISQEILSSKCRIGFPPNFRRDLNGFRCVLETRDGPG